MLVTRGDEPPEPSIKHSASIAGDGVHQDDQLPSGMRNAFSPANEGAKHDGSAEGAKRKQTKDIVVLAVLTDSIIFKDPSTGVQRQAHIGQALPTGEVLKETNPMRGFAWTDKHELSVVR